MADEVRQAVDKINSDLRASFTLISLTMISGFVGVRGALLADEWYTAPLVFVAMFQIAILYFSLVSLPISGFYRYGNSAIQTGAAIFFIGLLIENYWLAGGLIGGWVCSTLFVQIPIKFFGLKSE
ncbi:hypothetical protein DAH55_11825 [Sphingomonas koreensis]|uniref:hypothetical protein n=1 Tax=Sphingomonas koreensis TaxID=93064 RepID=UPI000834A777|nr:hypothetical protein [Sphingomonas koreensis]RSU60075.1 hypothetical protein DAH56_08990 [Sphingomonas koreensis]RSU68014.1 hypothetical protein DAH55_11825 [Sphingomonas koreensis]